MAKLEYSEHSIVVAAPLSPSQFHPLWFENNNLLRPDETSSLEAEDQNEVVNVIHPDITSLNLGWGTIEVNRQKFIAKTMQDDHHEVLKDLVLGTFSVLKSTIVTAVGINFQRHYILESDEKFDMFMKYLLPANEISSLFDGISPAQVGFDVKHKSDEPKGETKVKIAPLTGVNNGILININDHFELAEEGEIVTGVKVSRLLSTEWSNSVSRILGLTKQLIQIV